MADETAEVEQESSGEAEAEETTATAEGTEGDAAAEAGEQPAAEGEATEPQTGQDEGESQDGAPPDTESAADVDASESEGGGAAEVEGQVSDGLDLMDEMAGGQGVELPEMTEEVKRILHLEVPVIVKLADKQLPLGDIVDLSMGSIVEFSKNAEMPLDLLVNNKVVARGTAVKVGEKFGLRIDEILPVEETIRVLGG